MLVWVTLFSGIAVCVLGSLAVVRVDRRWRRRHLQCCRCQETWFGEHTVCERCGARGNDYDWLVEKYRGFPTHDWQGYLDTGPIPVVPAAGSAGAGTHVPEPREPVDYSADVWSAPAAPVREPATTDR